MIIEIEFLDKIRVVVLIKPIILVLETDQTGFAG
jgi:hypothetical protein